MRVRRFRITGHQTGTLFEGTEDEEEYEVDFDVSFERLKFRNHDEDDAALVDSGDVADEVAVMRCCVFNDNTPRIPGGFEFMFNKYGDTNDSDGNHIHFYSWLLDAGSEISFDAFFQVRFEAIPGTLRTIDNVPGSSTVAVTAMLKLQGLPSGGIPITLYAAGGTVTTDLEIIGDEWYAHATSAGDPAWDAATGGPINGGPGA